MRVARRGLALALGPLLVGAGSIIPFAAGAAQSTAPPPGSRVRIRHEPNPGRWLTGVLRAGGPDTVAIDDGRGRWVAVVPAATVRRMEVSRGAESGRQAATRGAVRGGAIGVVGGAFLGWFGDTCRDTDGDVRTCEREVSRSGQVGGAAAAGAVVGAAIGALVTRGRRRERWEPIALPLRIGLGAPSRGGVRLSGTRPF